MRSIRKRFTALYALALGVTIVATSLALWIERRQAALNDLEERANTIAELGARIVGQAGASDEEQRIFGDSTKRDDRGILDPQFGRRFNALLDVLPEHVIITDSTRIIFASLAVRSLDTASFRLLTAEALRIGSSRLPSTRRVPLAGDVIQLSSPHDVRRESGLRRVIAGVSMKPLDVAMSEVLSIVLVAAPLILLGSVAAAWAIGGRFVHLETMVNDVEAITDGRSLHKRIREDDDDDEISRLGTNLNAMLSRLEGSFASLRRFTADASHEFKTPLTVLRADIERAMSLPSVSTEQLVALEEALAETTRMATLVDALLTLARADEGRLDLHREPVDLSELVHDIAETANILGEVYGLRIAVTKLESVHVLGDRARLRQLFLNLVENAVKYSSKGGKVEISLSATDGRAAFSVTDHGIGIAGTDLPFIFERFWRVDRARSRSERAGSGLGLAICQWIAQAHGGSIHVSSRLGRGSTFVVSLPAQQGTPMAEVVAHIPVTERVATEA